MPTHGCIACPECTVRCCICAGPDHRHSWERSEVQATYGAVDVTRLCLHINVVGGCAWRCQNRTTGFQAYCDEHRPDANQLKPGIDKAMVVTFVMIAVSWVLGFLTHAWWLPWLRGEP